MQRICVTTAMHVWPIAKYSRCTISFSINWKESYGKNVTRVIVKHAIIVGVMKINYDLDFMYLFLLFRFDNSSYL